MSDAEEYEDSPFDPVEGLSLDDALAIVSEETRATIIAELGAATRDGGVVSTPLAFSELMERVGAEDSGRFNYHLDKLVDTFVRKTDEGYLLRPPGEFVYRAIVSGTLTDREAVDPFAVGGCPDCAGELVAEYPANHCFYVRCRDCDTFQHAMALPNSGLDERTPAAALEAAVRKRHAEVTAMRQGVCHACGAVVERTIDREGYDQWDEFYGHDVYAVLSCRVCNVGGFGHPSTVAVVTPAAVAFFDDHGQDATAARPWEDPLVTATAETTVDEDRVTVPFAIDGERLSVTLDDDLQVVETDRGPV
jgi:hypothetical protein